MEETPVQVKVSVSGLRRTRPWVVQRGLARLERTRTWSELGRVASEQKEAWEGMECFSNVECVVQPPAAPGGQVWAYVRFCEKSTAELSVSLDPRIRAPEMRAACTNLLGSAITAALEVPVPSGPRRLLDLDVFGRIRANSVPFFRWLEVAARRQVLRFPSRAVDAEHMEEFPQLSVGLTRSQTLSISHQRRAFEVSGSRDSASQQQSALGMTRRFVLRHMMHFNRLRYNDTERLPVGGSHVTLLTELWGQRRCVLRPVVRAQTHFSLGYGLVLSLHGHAATVFGEGSSVPPADALHLSADVVRGWVELGPRDEGRLLGGGCSLGGSASLGFPLPIDSGGMMRGHVFAGAGSLCASPLASGLRAVRRGLMDEVEGSVGMGLVFALPVDLGRLELNLSLPVRSPLSLRRCPGFQRVKLGLVWGSPECVYS